MTDFPTFTNLGAAVWPGNADVDQADVQEWALTVERALNAALTRSVLMNGGIVASVDSNVLTVAVKTLDGDDPSAAKPVYADWRSSTASSGLSQRSAITSALSMTVSAGATLDFASGEPGRLWVVLMYDGGDLALGVFNALGSDEGDVYPLDPTAVRSSTDEAGDGSADSPGVVYTDGAVASSPMLVLGHLTWETALGTAGLWSAAPDTVYQQRHGDRLPGEVVQRKMQDDGAVATGTTVVPFDNTVPTSSEGDQYMTQAITPQSGANLLHVEHDGLYASSVEARITAALFAGGAAAIAARAAHCEAAGDPTPIRVLRRQRAGGVAEQTFTVRAGPSTAGTVSFNGSGGTQIFNGVCLSHLEVTEVMA